MANPENTEDPALWSVDRVIFELCHNPRPNWAQSDLKLLSNSAAFEAAFRSNDISGDVLLELNESDIKGELDIPSFGQRRRLMNIIDELRDISPHYSRQQEKKLLRKTPHLSERLSTIQSASAPPYQPSIETDRHIPTSRRHTSHNSLPHPAKQSPVPNSSAENHSRISNSSLPAAFESLKSEGSPNPLDASSTDIEAQQSSKQPSVPAGLDGVLQDKKRAAEWSSTSRASQSNIPSEVTSPRMPVGAVTVSLPQYNLSKTRSVTSWNKTAKRVVPTSTVLPTSDVLEATSPIERQTKPVRQWNLKRANAEKDFLSNANDTSTTFGWVALHPSPTQPRAIARHMNRFLAGKYHTYHTSINKSETRSPRESKSGAKLPRQQRLRRGDLTKVLTPGTSGYEVHKVKGLRAVDQHVRDAIYRLNSTQVVQPSELASDDISQYRYLLEKYPEADDDDDVLPLYGDSDDEDRFTTSSMSPEPIDRSDTLQEKIHLGKAEIDAVIDQAIESFKSDWRQRKLGFAQNRAFQMWRSAFKSPMARRSILRLVTHSRDLAQARLPGLRQAIHLSTWTKVEDVRRQCESLQATVDQYEENQHYIQALGSEQAPPRTKTVATKRPQVSRPSLEEDEIDCETDQASVDGLIIEDDDSVGSESDGSLPDVHWAPQDVLEDRQRRLPKQMPVESIRTQVIRPLFYPDEASAEETVVDSPDVLQLSCNNGDDNHSDEMQGVEYESPRTPVRRRPSDGYAADDDEVMISNIVTSARRSQSTKKRIVEELGEHVPVPASSVPLSESSNHPTRRIPVPEYYWSESSSDEHGPKSNTFGRPKKIGPAPFEQHSAYSNSVQSSTNDDEHDSSSNRFAQTGNGKWRNTGKTATEPIDLSNLTSSPAHSADDVHHIDSLVHTPELNPSDSSHGSDPIATRRPPPTTNNRAQRAMSLPDLTLVRVMRWTEISQDPENHVLGLARAVTDLTGGHQDILAYVQSSYPSDLEDHIKRGLGCLKSEDETVIDIPRNKIDVAMSVTWLFLHYACVDYLCEELLAECDCDLAWSLTKTDIPTFQALLTGLLRQQIELLQRGLIDIPASRDSGFDTGTETATDMDSDMQILGSGSRGKRASASRKLKSSKNSRSAKRDRDYAPANSQRMAKQRVADQEARKAILTQKLALLPVDSADVHVPVNFKEPIVFLDQYIARRIKPHQVSGLQFLWRELIEDEQRQGCLLAHTMGLGKTMQVISLLVTIKLCIQAANPAIRAHIPEHMRDLRVLILCPASLAENWCDELLLWMPKHDTLGNIMKISSQQDQPYANIASWAETGGVLILSYNRFHLYTNPPTRRRQDTAAKMEEQTAQYQRMSQWLTTLPKIVVADEAHMLKNPASKTTTSAGKLQTLSRIALTGSPLSNHIEEYWAMINFVAPNYLGSLKTFQQKFVTPINASLASDSKPFERRVGLKKMHILRKLVAPKVNRADITAIKNDLPSKTEFFITVPLTELQKRAYQIFIQHCRDAIDDTTGRGKTTKLFHWVSILTLLCNHPHAFVSRLRNKKEHEDQRKAQEDLDIINDVGDADDGENNAAANPDITNQPAILDGMLEATAVFKDVENNNGLKDPSLSYRALLVSLIVEETLTIGEKVLIFSHSLPSLDYLGIVLKRLNCPYERIDGAMATHKRQHVSKNFNAGRTEAQAFIISTRAGGLGLNLQGATRVIIFDYGFNPSWEEQAIGRAYRIGQKKPVFVYRFRAGGTFEQVTFNSAVFKTQLFTRVIDHKAIQRKASKADAANYFFDPTEPDQWDLSGSEGKDPHVLDKVMKRVDCIRNIELTETFAQEIVEDLTEQEIREVNHDIEMENLRRTDPAAYQVRRNSMAIARTGMVGSPDLEVPGFAPIRDALHGSPSYNFVRSPRPYGPGLFSAAPLPQAEVRASHDDNSQHVSGTNRLLHKKQRPSGDGTGSTSHGLDGSNDEDMESYEVHRALRGQTGSEGARGCSPQ